LSALLLFGVGYFGADSLLTMFMTAAEHSSLYEAGAALTVGGTSWGLASLVAPRLRGTEQSRTSRLAYVGLAATAAGTLALSAAGPAAGIAAWGLASAGVGLAYPALSLAATTTTTVPPAEVAEVARAGLELRLVQGMDASAPCHGQEALEEADDDLVRQWGEIALELGGTAAGRGSSDHLIVVARRP
jgi:hypothetical protein